jgi:hypothetical protein
MGLSAHLNASQELCWLSPLEHRSASMCLIRLFRPPARLAHSRSKSIQRPVDTAPRQTFPGRTRRRWRRGRASRAPGSSRSSPISGLKIGPEIAARGGLGGPRSGRRSRRVRSTAPGRRRRGPRFRARIRTRGPADAPRGRTRPRRRAGEPLLARVRLAAVFESSSRATTVLAVATAVASGR